MESLETHHVVALGKLARLRASKQRFQLLLYLRSVLGQAHCTCAAKIIFSVPQYVLGLRAVFI